MVLQKQFMASPAIMICHPVTWAFDFHGYGGLFFAPRWGGLPLRRDREWDPLAGTVLTISNVFIGLLLIGAAKVAACGTEGHAGAPQVFSSADPLTVQVAGLMAEGRLAEAEALLDRAGRDAGTSRQALVEEAREIIRRIRREYGLAPEEMVEKLRRWIPDVSAADVERWRLAGELQFRMLDGQIRFFSSEPLNLWRFCEEARRRRDKAAGGTAASAPADGDGALDAHVTEALAAARASGKAEVLPVRHVVKYALTVKPGRPGAAADSVVRCWLPYPQVYGRQREVRLRSADPAPALIAPPGTEPGGAAHRTVFFERRVGDPAEPLRFAVEFEFLTSAYCPELDEDRAQVSSDEAVRCHLAERRPHLAFTPELRAAVAEAVGGETNPLRKARRIFEYIDSRIRYCAEEEYSVIPSLSAHALSRRRGDCGVQAALFISMCRTAGIPARWQSGFFTQPGHWNMHDWAEFHLEPWGWLPADPSFGRRKSDEPAVRDFYLGHSDAYRMIVNLDYGAPLHPPKTSLRSEPADFQRGEVEIDGRNLYFDEWDWDLELHHLPG